MAKGKKQSKSAPTKRPERVKLTAAESLKRMQAFDERKEAIVAAVQRGKLAESKPLDHRDIASGRAKVQ